MDDLNQATVASLQHDRRVHTFVVRVPTLGAEEKHAAAAVPLMPGPRVNHYRDPGGNTGLDFQEALDIDMYAWDVWMIYEPGALWEDGSTPTVPAFWQHQLGGLPRDSRLDADEFAEAVTARLADMPPASNDARIAALQPTDSGLLAVAEPLRVIIAQNHRSRGGYETLKAIDSIRYEGETEVDGSTYPLTLETHRPHLYMRRSGSGVAGATARRVARCGRCRSFSEKPPAGPLRSIPVRHRSWRSSTNGSSDAGATLGHSWGRAR